MVQVFNKNTESLSFSLWKEIDVRICVDDFVDDDGNDDNIKYIIELVVLVQFLYERKFSFDVMFL